MIETKVIKNADEFFRLKDEWNELLNKSSSNSITLTWEWLYTWWKIYGQNRALRIITIREDERLIGIAPLLRRIKINRYYKIFYFKTIEFLASGEESGHQVCSDYLDFIMEKGREWEIMPHILDCLTRQLNDEWDEIILPDISEESPNVDVLKNYSKENRLIFQIRKTEPCGVIKLPNTWEDFLASVSSNLRYKIRRGRKELSKVGSKYVRVQREDELNWAVQTLIDLHQERWTKKGEPGAFASPQRTAFHKEMIPICLKNGWLKLSYLEVNGAPIGSMYNFQYNNKIYFYQSGIVPQENKHIRPGLLLHSYGVEDAIADGLDEYDFLKRGKSDYKDSWANYTRNLLEIRIAKSTSKEHLYHYTNSVVNWLRKVKHFCEDFIDRNNTAIQGVKE